MMNSQENSLKAQDLPDFRGHSGASGGIREKRHPLTAGELVCGLT